jgi:aryl-alcohol dehydrogenase-like predicted oxidoreductase
MAVRPRPLGDSGLVAGPIGFNAVSFTVGCGRVDRDEATAIVSQLYDLADPLVDATDLTGAGFVEALLGRGLRRRRDGVVLASRCGARYSERGELTAVDGRPESVVRACDTTLRRLHTDHLDLYFLDRVDPQVPIEESVGALAGLVAAGKIRNVGLSHVDAAQLHRGCAVHPVAVVAVDYSLIDRRAEVDLLPAARSLGVSVAAYRPLGSGLLTGSLTSLDQLAVDDYRRADPRFQPRTFARGLAVARAAERLASQRHLSVGRLALTWLLAQGTDIIALPGTRNLTHLEMNLAAADVTLTADERSRLASLTPPRPRAERAAGTARGRAPRARRD